MFHPTSAFILNLFEDFSRGKFRFETDKQYCLVKLFFSNNCNVIKSKCFFIKGTKLISLQGLHFKKLQFSTLGNTDLFYLSKKRPPNNNFILWPKINLSCLHLSFSIYLMDANQFQEEVKILHFFIVIMRVFGSEFSNDSVLCSNWSRYIS